MLVFLKLGGSLITDKTRPQTPRLEKLNDLARQVAAALKENPGLQIVLGHGSGSFGHPTASHYGTRRGVSGKEAWNGFSEVWYQASTLNRLVTEAFHAASLPVLTLSPAASVTAHEGKVFIWDLYQVKTTLAQGLIPIIHGDVAFDDVLGGTILSTEDLFAHLAHELRPDRILLAGLETGVWRDFPARTDLLRDLTPETAGKSSTNLGASTGMDVTGGMLAKVNQMLALVEKLPGLEVLIFSGEEPENILYALRGHSPGTRLHR
jgi:isopentenyl phosphate kinase